MIELDEADKKILRELQDDARVSFKTIARKIGMSEATIFVRVRKLREAGVIKGFRAIIDPKTIGKTLTAFVLVRAMPKAFPGMLNALKKLDDIYEIYDVTGQYYSIVKLRTTGADELSKIMDEIGTIDGVAGTETLIAMRTIKEEVSLKI